MTISQSSTADRAGKLARASASAVSLLAQSLPLGVEANCTALFHDLEAISFELRLMHPLGPGRRRLGRRGEAGRMETQGRCHGADMGLGRAGFDRLRGPGGLTILSTGNG